MRALSGKDTASDAMTLDTCATFCAGFKYFGVEYAREWLVLPTCLPGPFMLTPCQLLRQHLQHRLSCCSPV
jgi:hypothetical protein